MQTNRRNFLKLSGAASIGMLGGCQPQNAGQLSAEALTHIRREAMQSSAALFNMSGYAAPPIDVVRIGIVGMGSRGSGAVTRLSYIEGVELKAFCDVVTEKAEAARERIRTSGHNPTIYGGSEEAWMELCRRDDIDLIYITTPWSLHAPIALYAMEQGKHVATEIPAATSVSDCWKLVETSERTRKHCVMLENCCYDFFELLTLNLARNGFFGEIIHCEGAYIHDIGESLFFRGKPDRSWRLQENMSRNGSLYPTHGLGPVAQIMNINRGNRMEYLVSVSTNDFMMKEHAKRLAADDEYFRQFTQATFRGNMNTTTIKTVRGQTILIQHDVTSPRPYSRIHLVSGTLATAQKYPLPGKIATDHRGWIQDDAMVQLEKEYNPEIVKRMRSMAETVGGHGGMDFLMDWRLIDCLRNGLPVDMDVYDAAAWSVVAPLSEWSVANRSAPIDIPDFTHGNWENNTPHDIELAAGGTTGVRL